MLLFELLLHKKQNMKYQRFAKCQERTQIIKAPTEYLNLSRKNILIFLVVIPIGPAMLQDHKTKKRKQKSKTTHTSFNLFIKQLHKINSNSVT